MFLIFMIVAMSIIEVKFIPLKNCPTKMNPWVRIQIFAGLSKKYKNIYL